MLSSRVPRDLAPNRLALALDRARAETRELLDLTTTNPTLVGIEYAADLLDPLAQTAGLRYTPSAFGLETARNAVSLDYLRRGIRIASSRLVLTASTSEAYSVLFKLLCAPAGDHVLVPVPSYPLFDHLTRLDGVNSVPYRLEYHGRWTVDVGSVDHAWLDSIRALLVVSPNNPTGSVIGRSELDAIARRCADRDAALIVDEVFADYALGDPLPEIVADAVAQAGCLCFRLGGLSKSAGLPQVKLGWIAADGPAPLVDRALERLELICDTYLSVSTPVQLAAPALIASGARVREQILARVRRNFARLRTAAAAHPAIEVLHADGGWSAVLRVPSTVGEEELVLELLERDGVVVHPGFFFDLPSEAFLVVSLLPAPAVFDAGIGRLLERADV